MTLRVEGRGKCTCTVLSSQGMTFGKPSRSLEPFSRQRERTGFERKRRARSTPVRGSRRSGLKDEARSTPVRGSRQHVSFEARLRSRAASRYTCRSAGAAWPSKWPCQTWRGPARKRGARAFRRGAGGPPGGKAGSRRPTRSMTRRWVRGCWSGSWSCRRQRYHRALVRRFEKLASDFRLRGLAEPVCIERNEWCVR